MTLASSVAPDETIRLREATAVGRPGHAGKAILFVHGATYPGVMFDVPGASWLTRAVADGYDAYAIDIRGYGGSYRPPAMDEPADIGEAFCRAGDAMADIADAVAFIRRRTGTASVDIVGWSWGTITSGCYAATRPGTIGRLVLFAPIYATPQPDWTAALAAADAPHQPRPLGAYRQETQGQADARWAAEITAVRPEAWRDPAILDAWFTAMLVDEPGQAVRAPNGVLLDLWEALSGRALYSASDIAVPTLVIRGGADTIASRTDGLALFDALGSEHKQYIEIANASHYALLEHRRHALHANVAAFLSAAMG